MEILLFGITKEIIGKDILELPNYSGIETVSDLREWLTAQYPALKELHSLAIAVDNHFAGDDDLVNPSSELALIPPTSGG